MQPKTKQNKQQPRKGEEIKNSAVLWRIFFPSLHSRKRSEALVEENWGARATFLHLTFPPPAKPRTGSADGGQRSKITFFFYQFQPFLGKVLQSVKGLFFPRMCSRELQATFENKKQPSKQQNWESSGAVDPKLSAAWGGGPQPAPHTLSLLSSPQKSMGCSGQTEGELLRVETGPGLPGSAGPAPRLA